MKSYLIVLLFLVFTSLSSQTFFRENFDQPNIDLKKSGWLLDKNENRIRVTKSGLEIDTSGMQKRLFAKRTITCEFGKLYSAEIMVKTENVNLWNNSQRGATIFIGFLNSAKQWVIGGTFPHGSMNTSEWQRINIPIIKINNPSVKYLQIWVGIEGAGKAWFRNLRITEIQLNQDFEINIEKNPIAFKFSMPENFFNNSQTAALLELHRKNSHDSFRFILDRNEFVLPHGLCPGEWIAVYSVSSSGEIFFQKKRIFLLKTPPLPDFYTAEANFPNGVYTPKPELEIRFYPALPQNVPLLLTCNNKPTYILRRTTQSIHFRTNLDGKLNPGTYLIHLVVGNKEYDFFYNNHSVKHSITFRDDKIMILNGKPFFPIGTYRDPSDWLYTFTGIKQAGFNMTHSYVFEESDFDVEKARKYLAACHQNGVLTFLGISRKALRNRDFNAIKRFCSEVSGENAAFLWYLIDEPVWQKISPFYVREYYHTIKQIVPQIPVIQLHTPIKRGDSMLAFYGREGDIFWHDTYPVPKDPLYNVYIDAMTAVELAPTQAVWSVIQAFDPSQKAVRSKKPEDVEPKAGKIRCMTHLAIAGGARGIIFYWLPKNTYDFRKNAPVQWSEVCNVSRELNELSPFLTGRDVNLNLSLPYTVKYWAKSNGSKTGIALINSGAKALRFDLMIFNERKQIFLNAYEVQIFIGNQ